MVWCSLALLALALAQARLNVLKGPIWKVSLLQKPSLKTPTKKKSQSGLIKGDISCNWSLKGEYLVSCRVTFLLYFFIYFIACERVGHA